MSREKGDYQRGDILDANTTTKKIGKIQQAIEKLGSVEGITELKIGDNDEVKAFNMKNLKEVSIEDSFLVDINYGFGTGSWNANDGGKAFITTATGVHVEYIIGADGSVTRGKEIDVLSINNDLFEVVTQLPDVAKAKKGHIYCVKDNTSKDDENRYSEYVLIYDDDAGTYKWEIIGQFHADPDLSGYAKLSGATFTGDSHFENNLSADKVLYVISLGKYGSNFYLKSSVQNDVSRTKAYVTDGSIADIGSSESFIFTLEDGTKVTKNIRVISTTNQTE